MNNPIHTCHILPLLSTTCVIRPHRNHNATTSQRQRRHAAAAPRQPVFHINCTRRRGYHIAMTATTQPHRHFVAATTQLQKAAVTQFTRNHSLTTFCRCDVVWLWYV
ncbi:hypothetical protein JYU34_022052 [Plutella xylostella]|uniref:Uncharacterized protein n=1 Tax=Plutella xylostella TaxID=51655 RepID=A0ABQ7PQ54_PLUXY|nr:hypothetical protein JYU34_022052 [Plutella xylostella]